MATTVIPASKPEMPATTLRELISSFVRKSGKSTVRGKFAEDENLGRIRRSSSCNENFGSIDCEFSTDSFLELSSEVSPIDDDTWGNNIDDRNGDTGITENGNLWKDEVRRKCVQLTKSLDHQLQVASKDQHGLNLKIPDNLAQRIAKKIVNTASSEPCGLRGCCVYLRLLHEDVAHALMTSHAEERNVSRDRSEKCASWPEAPMNTRNMRYDSANVDRQPLHFRYLPDMDATLTENFSPESSTDSGFGEGSNVTIRTHRRVHQSSSSPSISSLPKLSAASRLQVACADIGRLDLCDSDSVPTFEVYVYLAPVTSWTWWLRKFFSSSIKMDKDDSQKSPGNSGAARSITVIPDFTLVKRKLYRSRSNSLEVIRCPLPS